MKAKTMFFTVAFVALSAVGVAFAQNGTPNANGSANRAAVTRGSYVDNNKNGVCDNFEARHANGTVGRGQGYGNGRGGGKGLGRGQGHGPNYVDKNNNGICDYRETPTKK
ncbi:MAG: hypothetical protein ACP5F6_02345 [Microbacter sp.]